MALGGASLGIFRRVHALLPEEPAPAPVEFNLPLVGFVAALIGGATLFTAATLFPVSDWATLVIGGGLVFVASYCSVRTTGGVDSLWTSSLFVHLALTFTLGPWGAVVASITQAAATGARMKSGMFRVSFNAANFLIADLCAWMVYSRLVHAQEGLLWGASVSTLAGAAECVVNNALLAIVITLASRGAVPAPDVFKRSLRSLLLYSIGYGWAAFGAVLLYRVGGTIAFTTTLVPVILLQGFLLLLARRIRAQEAERAAHTKEREALLQQAIDASDAERKRIASDLHDGVVQTLAGLAFSLAARGAGKDPDPILTEAADTLRSSVTDLRTLMIEIAPPDLAVSGVDSALRKLLEPLPAKGIEVELDAATATHLPADKTSLVFRVAQEAIRNVVNHSQATKVVTSLRYGDGILTLRVTDNGKGFSAADRTRRREEGHVGLSLLNNAVEASSGRLSLESEPGHGTSLMLVLPC
jgi:signal transduction histidine kinase